jgi:hypothetical protein
VIIWLLCLGWEITITRRRERNWAALLLSKATREINTLSTLNFSTWSYQNPVVCSASPLSRPPARLLVTVHHSDSIVDKNIILRQFATYPRELETIIFLNFGKSNKKSNVWRFLKTFLAFFWLPKKSYSLHNNGRILCLFF